MTRTERIGRFIQTGSTIVVLTIVALLLVNLALRPFAPPLQGTQTVKPNFAWSEAQAQKWLDHYGIDVVRRVYPGKSDDEIRKIIFAKFQVGNRYEPFVEFLQDPVFLDGIGVHEAGFRFGGKAQGPWPPDKSRLNVFVFGGSTAFGSGAADEETVSAQLQQALSARLGKQVYSYNFGVGAYYSSQEVINMWRLARDGHFPDLVVFLDGLNDYFQKTEDTAHSGYYRNFETSRVALIKQAQADRGTMWYVQQAVMTSPMARFAASFKKEQLKPATPGAESLGKGQRTVLRTFNDEDRAHVAHVTDRLLNNFRLAAGMAGSIRAESAFVIQPTPVYAHELERHPFPVPEWHQYTRIGYPVLKKRLDAGVAENVLWCAEVQKGVPADVALYVDPVHYTGRMQKIIVDCIVDGLERSQVVRRLAQKKKG
jgi:hypothetical protein